MNILLLGSSGQLGHALRSSLKDLGNITALDRRDLDLGHVNLQSLEALFLRHRPDWVINASAYTAVDLAETHREEAIHLNANVPEWLALSCTKHKAALIHFSTDFVFDGSKTSPYTENDSCHPLSVYGQSKLQGELAVRENCNTHLIFRTGWLMGPYGGNFLKTMLRLASTKSELKVIEDQIGAPTPASWLAEVTRQALIRCHNIQSHELQPDSNSIWGLYHASGAGAISWHHYAKTVINEAHNLGFNLTVTPDKVFPIPSSDYPLPAKRPAYSVLNCNKLKRVLSLDQLHWHESIVEVLKQISSNSSL